MSSDDYVNIGPVTVKRTSGKAALLILDGKEEWVPFSQSHEDTLAEFAEGAKLEKCVIKRWIADEKGFSAVDD